MMRRCLIFSSSRSSAPRPRSPAGASPAPPLAYPQGRAGGPPPRARGGAPVPEGPRGGLRLDVVGEVEREGRALAVDDQLPAAGLGGGHLDLPGELHGHEELRLRLDDLRADLDGLLLGLLDANAPGNVPPLRAGTDGEAVDERLLEGPLPVAEGLVKVPVDRLPHLLELVGCVHVSPAPFGRQPRVN